MLISSRVVRDERRFFAPIGWTQADWLKPNTPLEVWWLPKGNKHSNVIVAVRDLFVKAKYDSDYLLLLAAYIMFSILPLEVDLFKPRVFVF